MKIKYLLKVVAFIAIILCVGFPHIPVGASKGSSLPVFSDFVNAVMDGEANIIRGVYAPGIMAFPVVQQPQNDPSAVTENDNEVTQFGLAERNRVIGLLAHNTLAGETFSNLRVGQEIRIIYGNSRVDHFVVDHMARYKVMLPGSQDIGYLDLSTYKVYNTQEVFRKFYEGKTHVTFQTCIQMGGDTSWGRLFITAIPVPTMYFRELQALNLTDLQVNLAVIKTLELFDGTAIAW